MVGQSGINCLKAAIKIEPTANDPLLIRAASDSASQIMAQQMASKCDSGSWSLGHTHYSVIRNWKCNLPIALNGQQLSSRTVAI